MNVSLTPKLEKLIQQKIRSGLYSSASEVVREALRLLEERDRANAAKLDALRKDIVEGLEQAQLGAVVEGRAVFKRLREKATRAVG
jgi:antitoxin ParD1/3/4